MKRASEDLPIEAKRLKLPQRVEARDVMPRQVAVELLCKSPRMTNRERKVCMQALETHYVSAAQPREDRAQAILANRCRTRTVSHLIKRYRRCVERRKLVQDAYVIVHRRLKTLEEKTEKPSPQEVLAILFLQRQKAELELRAAQIDLAWDVVTEELERRNKLCKNTKKST